MINIIPDTKDLRSRFFPNYRGVMYGPELEFFTVDERTLEPRNLQKEFSESSHFGTGIKFELPAEQIEIVCPPEASLPLLQRTLTEIIEEALQIAHDVHALLLPVAYLPGRSLTITENRRYEDILEILGPPARKHTPEVASDQINIGARSEAEAFEIYNRFRRFLPVVTGFAVASPFIEGDIQGGYLCERMIAYDKVFTFRSEYKALTGFPPELNSLDVYYSSLAEMPIFQNPNALYKYMRPMPHRGVAAELRSIDAQPTLMDYLSVLALVKGLVQNTSFMIENEPEIDFRKNLEHGIYDIHLFECVLEAASDGLEPEESIFLAPLCRRVELSSTIAEKMLRNYKQNGCDIRPLHKSLAKNILGDSYV